MLREYLVSEAMHGLGVPTTRSLAVVSTGESLVRQRIEPEKVLTRVAESHLRVGTFELLPALCSYQSQEHIEMIHTLAMYALERHYPDQFESLAEEDCYQSAALTLLRCVIQQQISTVIAWLRVGFIHGVMNTDNMTLSGETMDYGPCAWLDEYHPEKVFSAIDTQSRYAFASQLEIALWNFARFAESLLPAVDRDLDTAIETVRGLLAESEQQCEQAWRSMMRHKLGLFSEKTGDDALFKELLTCMAQDEMDYTNTFRLLTESVNPLPEGVDADVVVGPSIVSPAGLSSSWHSWRQRWQARRSLEERDHSLSDVYRRMCKANPAVIPRNHQVEAALQQAEQGDLGRCNRILNALKKPYEFNPDDHQWLQPPPTPHQRVLNTFCGT